MKIGPYETGRVYCGDCLELMKAIPDGAIDAIMTDPPYSSGARQGAQMRSRKGLRRDEGPHGRWIGGDNLTSHGFMMLARGFGVEAHRLSGVGAHLFSFIDWRQWPILSGAIESAGWSIRSCLVWDKVHFGMGNGFRQQAEFILHASKGVANNFERHDLGTVFRCPRHKEDSHPTQKPESLLGEIISAVPGGVVLDPFAGSGTTGVACMGLGREFLGFEIDKGYCKLANDRIKAAQKGIALKEHRAGQKTLFE